MPSLFKASTAVTTRGFKSPTQRAGSGPCAMTWSLPACFVAPETFLVTKDQKCLLWLYFAEPCGTPCSSQKNTIESLPANSTSGFHQESSEQENYLRFLSCFRCLVHTRMLQKTRAPHPVAARQTLVYKQHEAFSTRLPKIGSAIGSNECPSWHKLMWLETNLCFKIFKSCLNSVQLH